MRQNIKNIEPWAICMQVLVKIACIWWHKGVMACILNGLSTPFFISIFSFESDPRMAWRIKIEIFQFEMVHEINAVSSSSEIWTTRRQNVVTWFYLNILFWIHTLHCFSTFRVLKVKRARLSGACWRSDGISND